MLKHPCLLRESNLPSKCAYMTVPSRGLKGGKNHSACISLGSSPCRRWGTVNAREQPLPLTSLKMGNNQCGCTTLAFARSRDPWIINIPKMGNIIATFLGGSQSGEQAVWLHNPCLVRIAVGCHQCGQITTTFGLPNNGEQSMWPHNTCLLGTPECGEINLAT